jgi:ribonuclease R
MYNTKELSDMCEHLNTQEQKANKAQRESIKYKQCEYLSTKVGEKFIGTISGVLEFGAFVTINENGCEGLLSRETLINEDLFLDTEKFCVYSLSSGETYKLGDEIEILVSRVSMTKKQIDFKIVLTKDEEIESSDSE